MQFTTSMRFVSAVMAASLALLATAEPIPVSGLLPRQYESYCCLPGCFACSSNSCLNGPCGGVVSLLFTL
ncbi:hypothetical protein M426DRAFT_325069 [Hypoxylon sp. CI-4A]|nr:hypothetical protein M426DRAFT_325069 [Hypoxylon sp. CI-4A]